MTRSSTPRLLVRVVEGMGRGVFADKRIRKGEVIEVCPVIPLSEAEEKKLSGTILDRYMYAWGEGLQYSCIALGFGCLYNHSSMPNAVANTLNDRAQIEIVALREIKKGEQILIDYQWEESEYDFPARPEGDSRLLPLERRTPTDQAKSAGEQAKG